MDDTNELVARLTTAATIIMEDACPIAISVHPPDQLANTLDQLERATSDANSLIMADRIVATRDTSRGAGYARSPYFH